MERILRMTQRDADVEYYIAKKPLPMTYSVTKFKWGESIPLEEYEVEYSASMKIKGRPASRCQCMAWRSGKTRPCKHCDMVKLMVERLMQAWQDDVDFQFTEFVCAGKGSDWWFLRSEPQL